MTTEPAHPTRVPQFELRGRSTLRYRCPHCADPLTSPIADAGAIDTCPNCSREFVVPGEAAKLKLAEANERTNAVRHEEAEALRSVAAQRQKEAKARTIKQAAINSDKDLPLDRDPLKEWWCYALVVGIVLIAACGRHMITAIQTDKSYLCGVIFLLFGAGVILNYLGVRQLRVEYVCAAACIEGLDTPKGLKSLLAGPPAGEFHKHVQDLAAIARYDDHFTQDSLVTLLYSRLMAKSKIVEILSGVLVSLGLIGTIIGLISMTDGLGSTLESLEGDGTTLLAGMRTTMAGLGTAFYTTLAGALLGSVVLRILNNVYTSNVDHLVSFVASTIEVKVVPRLKQSARMVQARM